MLGLGFDPRRDEGADYAARFIRCDVPVAYQPEHSLIYGYIDLVETVTAANSARDRLIRSVDRMIRDLNCGT